MPTASERAQLEADAWLRLTRWSADAAPDLYEDRPARERDVVVYFDPSDDLARRARDAGATAIAPELDGLARFASQLARDESEAWATGVPDAAMRAYHVRRNLVGDRILHWAVPWLESVGRCYPAYRDTAHADRDWLLDLGDEMRVLPGFAHGEGLTLPGEDSYGPTSLDVPWSSWIRSVWSGRLVLDTTLASMGCDPDHPSEDQLSDLAVLFEVSAARWRTVASLHEGSAGLWLDLAARADTTAHRLADAAGE